jgi:RNA polymerase sigma-70 factor (ECF subfamily)
MNTDDHTLACLAARGDRQAFAELVRQHQVELYNVAWRMLGEPDEAEDAVQETYIRAYRAIPSYDPARLPGPWLRRIAANVCLNRLEARRPTRALDEDALQLASPEPGPESQAIAQERGRQVAAAVRSLPPRYRIAIELRHFQSLSYAEMAETLGRPLSDVKSDLFRARAMLAEKLKDLRRDFS